MRKLESVIASLSKQEIRNFKIYANRIKTINRQKKILLLFDAYKSGKYKNDDKLMADIFPELNKNAFYRLRNRLLDEIDQSLLMLYNDMDDKIIVTRCIMLAKISYHKNDYKSSYSLLLEAEKQALKNEFYDILNVIYNEAITLSSYYPVIDPRIYIQKIAEAEKKFAKLNELNRLIAEITYQLREKNYHRDDKSVKSLKAINEQLSASEIINNSFQAKLKVYTCIRDILHQEKKHHELKEYLIETYNTFTEQKQFTRTYHHEKIEMLVWTVNILLKVREFQLCQTYVDLLHEELLRYNKLYYEKYEWAYFQELFLSYYFDNQVPKSIEILTKLKNNYIEEHYSDGLRELPMSLTILFCLNLAVANYSIHQYEEALDAMKLFFHTETFKKLQNSLKLTILIVEMVIRYECGDTEYVLSRIREVKRSLRNLLAKEEYAREKEFINILRKLASNPFAMDNASVRTRIQNFVENSPPFEPGANEAISYRTFLEAQLTQVTYFECLKKYLQTNELSDIS